MRVIRKIVEVIIGVPDKIEVPEDDDIDRALYVGLDVLSKEEFDTLDDHPTWDFLGARVKRDEP